MEESTLYNLINVRLLHNWKEVIEKSESDNWLFTHEQKVLKELEAELGEKSKKLLTSYSLAIENRVDYTHHNLKIKILNLGIKIGMELQKSFRDFRETEFFEE